METLSKLFVSLTNLLSKQTKKSNLGSAATRQSPELKKPEFQVCSHAENKTEQGEQVWKLLKIGWPGAESKTGMTESAKIRSCRHKYIDAN